MSDEATLSANSQNNFPSSEVRNTDKSDPILTISNLVRSFGGLRAVDVDQLQVQRGIITAFIGPNGAGKTTLMRIINQITAPDSGSLLFDGVKLKEHHIADIGYLPEERGLYKKMKVGEQALYLAQLKGKFGKGSLFT